MMTFQISLSNTSWHGLEGGMRWRQEKKETKWKKKSENFKLRDIKENEREKRINYLFTVLVMQKMKNNK